MGIGTKMGNGSSQDKITSIRLKDSTMRKVYQLYGSNVSASKALDESINYLYGLRYNISPYVQINASMDYRIDSDGNATFKIERLCEVSEDENVARNLETYRLSITLKKERVHYYLNELLPEYEKCTNPYLELLENLWSCLDYEIRTTESGCLFKIESNGRPGNIFKTAEQLILYSHIERLKPGSQFQVMLTATLHNYATPYIPANFPNREYGYDNTSQSINAPTDQLTINVSISRDYLRKHELLDRIGSNEPFFRYQAYFARDGIKIYNPTDFSNIEFEQSFQTLADPSAKLVVKRPILGASYSVLWPQGRKNLARE